MANRENKILKLMRSSNPQDVIIGTFLFIKENPENAKYRFDSMEELTFSKFGFPGFQFPNVYFTDNCEFHVKVDDFVWKVFHVVKKRSGDLILN